MVDIGNQSPREKKWSLPLFVFFKNARFVFKLDELSLEILRIAFPAALALAADPIASLIDTAFIGRLGPVQLAAVGVAIAVFNQASKVTIFPLVSITTSFVAEEDTVRKLNDEASKDMNIENVLADNDTKELRPVDVALVNLGKGSGSSDETKESMPVEGTDSDRPLNAKALEENSEKNLAHNNTKNLMPDDAVLENLEKGLSASVHKSSPVSFRNLDKGKRKHKKRQIASASTALLLGGVLGIIQTIFLVFLRKPILSFMGIKSGSPMLNPAQRYLTIRSLGAPAVLLSLAMQGIFRGFKDTTTPLYATVAGDLMNIILDPILIFICRLGVIGAAIAHVLSQYLISLILLLKLMREVDLLPPSPKDLQLSRFLKSGILLLARVIAVTFCVTLAASMAARLGPTPMAAFQVCLQVWMTSSLLADGLAVAGQAILACAFAEKDYEKATAAAVRVLQMCFVMGIGLAVFVGLGLYFGSGIFSKDKNVVLLISIGIPFVAATQPINSLAFVFDGINFGASDFAYSAYSMVLVAGVSIASLFLLSKSNGFVGIWIALTIYMVLRAFAGIWRMGTGTGPWRYLRG